MLQIFLTVACVGTAIIAFVMAFMFEKYITELSENFEGDLTEDYLPCIRNPSEECDDGKSDVCLATCCPRGYECSRDPIVGLVCLDGTIYCGDYQWCRSFADITKSCPTDVCKEHQMVVRVTAWSYILAAMGIVLDLIDVIAMLTLPDFVGFKASVNVCSSLIKWVALFVIVGAGAGGFMTDLEEAKCYDEEGMKLVKDSGTMYVSYSAFQVVSACCSLVLAPFSAYYGGKLQGVPYVK